MLAIRLRVMRVWLTAVTQDGSGELAEHGRMREMARVVLARIACSETVSSAESPERRRRPGRPFVDVLR
jgi:hypothetical protein